MDPLVTGYTYRRRIDGVDAITWDGTDAGVEAVTTWLLERGFTGDAGGHGSDSPNWNDGGDFYLGHPFYREHAKPGDFIVHDRTDHDFYICPADVFHLRFEELPA